MKLVICKECQDVFKLVDRQPRRQCMCGKTKGFLHEDGLHGEISGPCIALGFSNPSLASAIRNQPESGQGKVFEAFVIPVVCPTVRKVKDAWVHTDPPPSDHRTRRIDPA
jgi:hypothetical protein